MIVLTLLIVFIFNFYSLSIFKSIPPSYGNAYTLTPTNYLFTQFTVIIKYIQLLIIPLNLNLDYDFPIAESIADIKVIFSLLLIIAVILLAFVFSKKNRVVSFGILMVSWFETRLIVFP